MTASIPVEPLPLRRDPAFRRYWLARLTSLCGSSVTVVAMPVLVYQLTGSALWTALVTVAEAAPYLCVGLVVGAIADRSDRRRTMIVADLVNAALLASIPLAYALDVLTAPHVLLVALAAQTMFVFFDASSVGALPAIVGRDRIAGAQAALFAASNLADLALPMLAGVALVVLPAAGLIAVDAVSFVVSALLIRAIARPFSTGGRTGDRRLWTDVRAGLRFVWGHTGVRVLTFAGLVQCLAGGAMVGQLVPWADRTLGVDPDDGRIGILFVAWGAGGVVGSVLFPRVNARLGPARTTLVFLPLSAAGGVAVALSTHWLVAAAVIGAWITAYMIVAIAQITMRQQVSPDHLQGRVHTVARVFSWGIGWPVGALVGGALAEAVDPRAAAVFAAAVLVFGAVVVWLSPLKHADRAEVAVDVGGVG
ncbi:MFS transporter [Virgisporangium aurantiacum]|uniref:MFS transporter n=1 Tax=Virgisporangium aurantiacum TaxID=175570 RepID=A0A8J3Z9Z9_9ACTN|nr:MFS transporter [Virgisporangium aurantiacum]GIJ60121.1 MFS transporter [Virgisporangium aurantiacum]